MKRQKVDEETSIQREVSESDSEGAEKGDSDGSADLEKRGRSARFKRKRGRGGRREVTTRRSGKTVGPLLYVPGEVLPELDSHVGSQLVVHVLAKHLTLTNDQVVKNEIWGIGPYSDDSDVVCILQHSGLYSLENEPPSFVALAVNLRILPGLDSYKGGEKNQMKSKSWGQHAVSLMPEGTQVLENESEVTKEPMERKTSDGEADTNSEAASGVADTQEELKLERRMTRTSSRRDASQSDSASAEQADPVAPTPRTRQDSRRNGGDISVAMPSLPRDSFVVWNLSNEPCFKYSFAMISDRGTDPTQWTSYRLRTAALFLETDSDRYELSLYKSASGGNYDTYRWARVKNPEIISRWDLRAQINVPLPKNRIEIIAENADWSEFCWGLSSVVVRGLEYPVKKLWWQSRFSLSDLALESVYPELK